MVKESPLLMSYLSWDLGEEQESTRWKAQKNIPDRGKSLCEGLEAGRAGAT